MSELAQPTQPPSLPTIPAQFTPTPASPSESQEAPVIAPVESRRRFRPVIMAAIMIVPLLIVLGLGLALIEANHPQLSSGVAPNFAIKTYTGDSFKLSDQLGKVVVVNFWAAWCGPCRNEAPDLNAIWDEYRDRGVVMIGVGWTNNDKDARDYINEFGIKYVMGNDDGSKVASTFHITGVPETYIIDKKGNLVKTMLYPTSATELRPILDKLLAE